MENQIQASGFVVQPRLQFKYIKDKILYLYLLYEADYLEDIGKIEINLSELEKEIGWSRKTITNSLKRIEKLGYINYETMYQKKGILVEIVDYSRLQKLENYAKNSEKMAQGKHKESTRKEQENDSSNIDGSRGESMVKNGTAQEKDKEGTSKVKFTEYLPILVNSINNNNNNNIKSITSLVNEAPVKNFNLSTVQEIEIFVDFASRTNALPAGTSKKILVSYFDCIRLTRQTCTISAKILAKFIEKLSKYSVNQIHYALWKHVEQHDDKKEQYTLGILRNTKEPEARRGLIKLKNKGGDIARASGETDSKYDYGF